MKQLDEELRGLFHSVRGADDPTPRQRERNRRQVIARIAAIGVSLPGVAVAAGASTATAKLAGVASTASSLWSTLCAGAFVGFSAVAVVSVVSDQGPKSSPMQASVPDQSTTLATGSVRNRASSAAAPTVVSTSQAAKVSLEGVKGSAIGTAAPLDALPEQEASAIGTASSPGALPKQEGLALGTASSPSLPVRSVSTASEVSPDLAAALAVLGRAQRLLADDQAEQAQAELERYAAQNPSGAMAEERNALRIVAMCKRGDTSGQQEAQRFLGATPRSPMVVRIRRACRL